MAKKKQEQNKVLQSFKRERERETGAGEIIESFIVLMKTQDQQEYSTAAVTSPPLLSEFPSAPTLLYQTHTSNTGQCKDLS